MAHSNYGPVKPFSPLDEDGTIYRSPATYSQPFPSYDHNHYGDLGSAEIEMSGIRPNPPMHSDTKDTVQSQATLFPSHSASSEYLQCRFESSHSNINQKPMLNPFSTIH
jgi:hypothetical protein